MEASELSLTVMSYSRLSSSSQESSPLHTHSAVYDNPFPDLVLPATTDPPSSTKPPRQSVWLIFGATGHFGRFVVETALKHGDKVCAVGRTFQDDPTTIQKWHKDSTQFLGILCDVRIRDTVGTAIDQAMSHFGRIDVIANCAGYGVIGSCEDQDEYEIRNQFETNFMGTLNIIQLSLPYFRERLQGRYLIFSSTSGALGVPGIGPFCATKYAVEGLVESMMYEVDGFNIKMTLVEPGPVRRTETDMGSRIPLFGHFKVLKPSEPYENKDSPARNYTRMIQWIGDSAPTSAVRAAELVWQLAHCSYPPLRLLLGTYAVESVRDRLKSIMEEIEDWKHLNFPPMEGQEAELEGDIEESHEDDRQDPEYDQEDEHEERKDGKRNSKFEQRDTAMGGI